MKFLLTAALLALGASAVPTSHQDTSAMQWHSWPAHNDANNVFYFTSTWQVVGTPDQVVNETTPTGGLPGSMGFYHFGINSVTNTICYNIVLHGFQGEFFSPADTATHIHEAAVGQSGPPRLAFPNPIVTADPNVMTSMGCLQGPFKTGVEMEGVDTADGFHLSQIEQNPAGFFADVHSSLAAPGANRGQLAC